MYYFLYWFEYRMVNNKNENIYNIYLKKSHLQIKVKNKPTIMSFYTNTQLTSAKDIDVNNIVFDKASIGSVPNSTMTFRRINLGYKNSDGTIGECIIPTEKLFSFGVQENKDMATGRINGYQMPLIMWSRNGATDDEKLFTDVFDSIVEYVKKWIVSDEGKDETENYEIEISDLKKLNPMYIKKEKGKPVEGASPTLYCKLIHSKKDDKILTEFYDKDGVELDARGDLMNKMCDVNAAIKFESVFVGNKISLQIKLYEAEVHLRENGGGSKRLLTTKPRIVKAVAPVEETKQESDKDSDDDDDEEVIEKTEENNDIQLSDDSDDDEVSPEPAKEEKPKKRVVRRGKK